MAEEKQKTTPGCILGLTGVFIAFLGIITGTIPVVILGGVVFVIGVFYDASKNKEALKKKKSNNDIVAELLEREYKKKEDELKRELEIKTAELEKMEKNLQDENKHISNEEDANKILITKDKFEAIYNHLKETCDYIWGICKESEFQNYIEGIKENSTDRTDNSKKLYSSLKFFIIKDILRSYERLGHRYYSSERYGEKFCIIDFDKAEGQVLYSIIAQMMQFDSQSRFDWSDFLLQMKGNDNFNRQLRQTTKEALGVYANADVHASASNGLDDFEFCIILHNYNEKYEKTYRVKMLRIATLIAKADDIVTDMESEWLGSIMDGGTTPEEVEEDIKQQDDRIKEDLQLETLIGLKGVKSEITTLRNFVVMKQRREQAGMKSPNISYHCVFTGNPGTGKTTVARILATIYKDLGIIKKGHLVETDRSGLVAEYVGQTAVKTNKIIDKALDGVLFVDEAYTLANGSQNDYGAEAIATLLKRMEDDRDRLIVILAGYTNEMEQFINSNPGLRSRFSRYIEFPDYSAEELYEIFCLQAKKNDFELSEGASERLMIKLNEAVSTKSKDFGNARYVRNLFEKAIESQANRLASKTELTKQDLTIITGDDIP